MKKILIILTFFLLAAGCNNNGTRKLVEQKPARPSETWTQFKATDKTYSFEYPGNIYKVVELKTGNLYGLSKGHILEPISGDQEQPKFIFSSEVKECKRLDIATRSKKTDQVQEEFRIGSFNYSALVKGDKFSVGEGLVIYDYYCIGKDSNYKFQVIVDRHGTDAADKKLKPFLDKVLASLKFAENNIAGWLNYDWGGYKFKYPSDWVLEKQYYRTPVQEMEGQKPEVIGLILRPKKKAGANDEIMIGGRQTDCDTTGLVKCVTAKGNPIYTQSANPEIIKMVELIADTVTFESSSGK